jgi:hypothetical protein
MFSIEPQSSVKDCQDDVSPVYSEPLHYGGILSRLRLTR